MTERDLLADCPRRLHRLGIPYMLTGSMAGNYWGAPARPTTSTSSSPSRRNAFRRRLAVTLFGEPAWVATPEDTILHELHWNRLQPWERQLGTAAGIRAVQGPDLDRVYLDRWAGDLVVSRTLEEIESGKIRVKGT